MSRDACSSCDEPAPKVRTAGTMAALGWRMSMAEPSEGRPMRVIWLCPRCAERLAGSAPLSRVKSKP